MSIETDPLSNASPVTQDLIAITLLYQSHAIDALMNGDLSKAFTLASPVFASIRVSMEEDHSRYGYRDTTELQGQGGPSQPFRELPAEFAKHLAFRRAEFSKAAQAWKADKTLPWAFIPPTQWDAFGIKGFAIPKKQ